MILNLCKAAIFGVVHKWLSPNQANKLTPAPFHPNLAKIHSLAIHYASLFTLLFLNFLLFVGGLAVTAVAAAHSFDVYGHFVPTAVFWTGIVMGATGLVIAAAAAMGVKRTKVTLNDLLYVEPEIESMTVLDRLVRPFFEGIIAGLHSQPARFRGENESYPAA
jgi:hypothetical protein